MMMMMMLTMKRERGKTFGLPDLDGKNLMICRVFYTKERNPTLVKLG
jgi:hypothetical protein